MCEDGAFKVLGVVVGWKLCFQAVGVAAVMVVLCVGSNGLFVILWVDEPNSDKNLRGRARVS
jgi:hypothetical protein